MVNMEQKAKNTDKVVFTTLDIQEAVSYAARQEKKHPEQFVFVNCCAPCFTSPYYNVYVRNN